MRAIDITGQTFGRLTVLRRMGRESGHATWLCRCNCSERIEVTVFGSHLHSGTTRSCGCLRREHTALLGRRNTKHGHTRGAADTPEYNSWRAMIKRCTNPNHVAYPRYGGRGITIDPHWLGEHGFENFLADMSNRPLGKSLDRIESNKNYNRDNCRWATRAEQGRNTRTTKLTLQKARKIRKLAAKGKKPIHIARLFSITPSHVYAVMNGVCWREAA